MIGRRFGRWTVIKQAENDRRSNKRWLCQCDCGTERIVFDDNLRRAHSTSCGCISREPKLKQRELLKPGKTFGVLTLICQVPNGRNRAIKWVCRCACGKETETYQYKLVSGKRKALYCPHNPKNPHPPEYHTWRCMRARCLNPNDPNYKWYGARGISVCDEWRVSFQAFLAHIGPKPSPIHTIERINNDYGYFPGNVRWATPKEQAANQRKAIRKQGEQGDGTFRVTRETA